MLDQRRQRDRAGIRGTRRGDRRAGCADFAGPPRLLTACRGRNGIRRRQDTATRRTGAARHREGLWVLRGTGPTRLPSARTKCSTAWCATSSRRGQPPGFGTAIAGAARGPVAAVAAALPRLADALGGNISANLGPEAFGEARTISGDRRLLDLLGSPTIRP